MEENNQKINCTVETCKYNNIDKGECILNAIKVTPMENCRTCKPDESMCSSYKYEDNH